MDDEEQKPSAADIQSFLREVPYPAPKDTLVQKARDAGAPPEVIETLQQLPNQEYGNPHEVVEKLEDIA